MSKYYSVLEQHTDDSWWYHTGWTFNSREEAESFAKDLRGLEWFKRPTRIYEHDEPLPDKTCEYIGNDTFGFAGLIYWENGKDMSGEYKTYIKH